MPGQRGPRSAAAVSIERPALKGLKRANKAPIPAATLQDRISCYRRIEIEPGPGPDCKCGFHTSHPGFDRGKHRHLDGPCSIGPCSMAARHDRSLLLRQRFKLGLEAVDHRLGDVGHARRAPFGDVRNP